MSTTTLATLRAELGYMLDAVKTGTTTSAGDTTSVISTGIKKYFREDINPFDKWVLMTSGDASGEFQMGTSYTYSTGDITTEAFTATTGNAKTFEVWDFQPDLVNKAIAKASVERFPAIHKGVTDESLTTLATMQNYKLPTSIEGSPSRVYIERVLASDFDENLVGGNAGFEDWTSGNPDDWSTATQMTVTQADRDNDQPVKYEQYAAKAVATVSQSASQYRTVSDPTNYAGQELTFAMWVYNQTASRVTVTIKDDQGSTDSSNHAGAGWQLMYATHTVTVAPASLQVGYKVSSGASIAIYCDNHWLTRGTWYPQYFWELLDSWTYDRQDHVIRFPYPLESELQLRLVGMAPLTEVSADTDTVEIAEPQAQIIYTASAHRLFEMLSSRGATSSDSYYTQQRDFWWGKLREMESMHSLGEVSTTIKTRHIYGYGNY